MTTPNRLPRAEAALREHALACPESYEEFPWGHRAIKVQKKTFLFLYRDAKQLSMSVKLPVSGRMALSLSFASPTEYGLGKSGWVTARFGPGAQVPLDMLREWIDESYRAIAPKKLVARLENADGGRASSKRPVKRVRPKNRARG
jgi:predicted DNA-binding protein (MmcQ/YjbR family)